MLNRLHEIFTDILLNVSVINEAKIIYLVLLALKRIDKNLDCLFEFLTSIKY